VQVGNPLFKRVPFERDAKMLFLNGIMDLKRRFFKIPTSSLMSSLIKM
jgi:hypothetical protein